MTFLTCITVLTDPDGNELGRTVRSFSDNSSTIITTDSKGQKLVKKFSNNMLNMEAVLTDAAGKELAHLTKVFSADGRTSLRPWFMGNKMQFEAVAYRLFLHYSYTLAQKSQ